MRRRRAGRLVLPGLLALWLAGCAAAEVPMPFIPEPETTATATPEPRPAAAPVAEATPAGPAAAPGSPRVQHGPMRADLQFPSFAPPPPAAPVMDDAQQKKMQSDLEGLAKQRETKMRQDIEQAQ